MESVRLARSGAAPVPAVTLNRRADQPPERAGDERFGHPPTLTDNWRSVLVPVIARYRGRGFGLYFRGDAAFAKPELYELLEAESMG